MDHHEQHHQHKKHDREEEIRHHKAVEREHNKKFLPFHPGWLLGFGMVLILVAVLIWTFWV